MKKIYLKSLVVITLCLIFIFSASSQKGWAADEYEIEYMTIRFNHSPGAGVSVKVKAHKSVTVECTCEMRVTIKYAKDRYERSVLKTYTAKKYIRGGLDHTFFFSPQDVKEHKNDILVIRRFDVTVNKAE